MGADYLLCESVIVFSQEKKEYVSQGIALFDQTEPKGLRIVRQEDGFDEKKMKSGRRYRLPDNVGPADLTPFEDEYMPLRDCWKLKESMFNAMTGKAKSPTPTREPDREG